MSVYSQTLKTEVFDPRVATQDRCEFRLDKDKMYFSNLRIGNLGVKQAGGTDIYSRAVGGAGVIRRLTLYDGATELDKCVECNRYLSWYLCGGENDQNRYVGQNLLKHGIGYALTDQGVVDGLGTETHRGNRATGVGHRIARDNEPQPTIETASAYLDVRQALPFLDKVGVLDTEKMFHNLRLVIEYEPDTIDGRAKVSTIACSRALQKLTPILICDEIRDEGMKSKARSQMKSFMYMAYEHDFTNIPAKVVAQLPLNGADNDTLPEDQKTVRKIDGYKNKIVNRLVVMKSPSRKDDNRVLNNTLSGDIVRGLGDYSSLAMFKEQVNFVVNGRQLLSGNGLDSAAKIADVHADAWSNYNITPFGNAHNVGLDYPGNIAPHNVYGVIHDQEVEEPHGQDPRVGQSSWIGVRIGERLNTLDLEYKRTVVGDQRSTAGAGYNYTGMGLDIHIYAEVPKQFVMDKGGYRIEYL